MGLLITVIAIVVGWAVLGVAVYLIATHVWMRHAVNTPPDVAHRDRPRDG